MATLVKELEAKFKEKQNSIVQELDNKTSTSTSNRIVQELDVQALQVQTGGLVVTEFENPPAPTPTPTPPPFVQRAPAQSVFEARQMAQNPILRRDSSPRLDLQSLLGEFGLDVDEPGEHSGRIFLPEKDLIGIANINNDLRDRFRHITDQEDISVRDNFEMEQIGKKVQITEEILAAFREEGASIEDVFSLIEGVDRERNSAPLVLQQAISGSIEGKVIETLLGIDVPGAGVDPFVRLPNKLDVVFGSVGSFMSPVSLSSLVIGGGGGRIVVQVALKGGVGKTAIATTAKLVGKRIPSLGARFQVEAIEGAIRSGIVTTAQSSTGFAALEGTSAFVDEAVAQKLGPDFEDEGYQFKKLAAHGAIGTVKGAVVGGILGLTGAPLRAGQRALAKSTKALEYVSFGNAGKKIGVKLIGPIGIIPIEAGVLGTSMALVNGRSPEKEDYIQALEFLYAINFVKGAAGLAVRGTSALSRRALEHGNAVEEAFSESNIKTTLEFLTRFSKDGYDRFLAKADEMGVEIPEPMRQAMLEGKPLPEGLMSPRILDVLAEMRSDSQIEDPRFKESKIEPEVLPEIETPKDARIKSKDNLPTEPVKSTLSNKERQIEDAKEFSNDIESQPDPPDKGLTKVQKVIRQLTDRNVEVTDPLRKGVKKKKRFAEETDAIQDAQAAFDIRPSFHAQGAMRAKTAEKPLRKLMREHNIKFDNELTDQRFGTYLEFLNERDLRADSKTKNVITKLQNRVKDMSPEDESAKIDSITKGYTNIYPGIAELAKKYSNSMRKDTINQVRKAGMISTAAYKKLLETRPQFVPRLPLEAKGAKGFFTTTTSAALRKLKTGTLSKLETDPWELLSSEIVGTSAKIATNHGRRQFAAVAKEGSLPKLFVEDPKGNAELLEKHKRMLKLRESERDDAELDVLNIEDIPIEEAPNTPGFKRVTYIAREVDGIEAVPQSFLVPLGIADVLRGGDMEINTRVAKIISLASGNDLTKLFATDANLEFGFYDFSRNLSQLLDGSHEYSSLRPIAYAQILQDLLPALSDVIGNKGTFVKGIEAGTGLTRVGTERRRANSTLISHPKVRAILAAMGYMGALSENTTRTMAFNRAMKNRKHWIDQARAAEHSAAVARKIIDFEQGGELILAMNQWVVYLNASIQGPVATARKFGQGGIATTFSLLQGAVIHGANHISNIRNHPEVLADIPDYRKQGYFNYILDGVTVKKMNPYNRQMERAYVYISIPMGQASGMVSALSQIVIDRYYKRDLEPGLSSIPGAVGPMNPALNIGGIASSTIRSLATNTDTRGVPIRRTGPFEHNELEYTQDIDPLFRDMSALSGGHMGSPEVLNFVAKNVFMDSFYPNHVARMLATDVVANATPEQHDEIIRGMEKFFANSEDLPFLRTVIETTIPGYHRNKIALRARSKSLERATEINRIIEVEILAGNFAAARRKVNSSSSQTLQADRVVLYQKIMVEELKAKLSPKTSLDQLIKESSDTIAHILVDLQYSQDPVDEQLLKEILKDRRFYTVAIFEAGQRIRAGKDRDEIRQF